MVTEEQKNIITDICSKVIELSKLEHRTIISITGVPASGKTTFSNELLQVIKDELGPDNSKLVSLVPMDGYHLTRSVLSNRKSKYPNDFSINHYNNFNTNCDSNLELDSDLYYIDGAYRPWPGKEKAFACRGAHWTFDAKRFCSDLRFIKSTKSDFFVPSFDHAVKDPIEDDIKISSECRVIFIEGLYPLLTIDPWFTLLQNVIDYSIFVDAKEIDTLRAGSKRNYEAGICSTMIESEERWKQNDIPNGRFLVQHMNRNNVTWIYPIDFQF